MSAFFIHIFQGVESHSINISQHSTLLYTLATAKGLLQVVCLFFTQEHLTIAIPSCYDTILALKQNEQELIPSSGSLFFKVLYSITTEEI